MATPPIKPLKLENGPFRASPVYPEWQILLVYVLPPTAESGAMAYGLTPLGEEWGCWQLTRPRSDSRCLGRWPLTELRWFEKPRPPTKAPEPADEPQSPSPPRS